MAAICGDDYLWRKVLRCRFGKVVIYLCPPRAPGLTILLLQDALPSPTALRRISHREQLKKICMFATLLICMISIALLILCEAFLKISSTALDIVWLDGRYWSLEDAPDRFVLPINIPLLRSNLILPDLVVKQLICTKSVGCMYVHFRKHY